MLAISNPGHNPASHPQIPRTRQKKHLCAVCRGELKNTTITHEEKRGNQLYLFQNVPAQVCSACGEVWIDEPVLQEIDRLIETGQPVRQVQTLVDDLAASH